MTHNRIRQQLFNSIPTPAPPKNISPISAIWYSFKKRRKKGNFLILFIPRLMFLDADFISNYKASSRTLSNFVF